MKSIIVHAKPLRCELVDVPVPIPASNEVLVKVVVCASNPRDWKAPDHLLPNNPRINQGNEMAGVVGAVGSDVFEFREGDRVAAAHPLEGPNGTYAEYATAPVQTCFLIPPNVTFEEACTIPFSLCTAALGLFQRLRIPFATDPASDAVHPPLIVYGAGSTVGAYTLKLAKLGPKFCKVIAVCGSGIDYLSKIGVVTHFVDYRNGKVVEDLRAALAGEKCYHAVDVINNVTSWVELSQVLDQESGTSKIAVFLPRNDYSAIPNSIAVDITFMSTVHGHTVPSSAWLRDEDVTHRDIDFAYALFRLIGRWLADGKLTAHPYQILPGGLTGVEKGLEMLKENRVNVMKLIYRIADTPGLDLQSSFEAVRNGLHSEKNPSFEIERIAEIHI